MKEPQYLRKIQSFVRREGRMTPSQTRALEVLWPKYGLSLAEGELNVETVFGRNAPLVLEIGFGMGEGLFAYAKAEPDKNFIGIEVHRPGVGALMNHLEQEELNNVRLFQEDALDILSQSLPDHSLDRVQLFFPDPWHKKRHHKRRIVNDRFMELLSKKLKAGGILHMATDWGNYAEHMLAVVSAYPNFHNLSATGDYIPRPDSRPFTRFEQRGLRLGHGVWDLQFKHQP